MIDMTSMYQRVKTFFFEHFSQLLPYMFALTFGVFVIMKLFAMESILQSNHHLLLENQSFSKQQSLMLSQLNRLESKLIVFESVAKTQQVFTEEVKLCRTELGGIKMALQQLEKNTMPNALALAINKVNKPLLFSNKCRLKKAKQKLHIKAHRNRDVSANTLPFQVLNIDMWNGEPMLMVNHQGHTDLLSQKDTLAGWTVVYVHFDSGRVTLRNRQGRLVRLMLS